jgi:hypothetical protein
MRNVKMQGSVPLYSRAPNVSALFDTPAPLGYPEKLRCAMGSEAVKDSIRATDERR